MNETVLIRAYDPAADPSLRTCFMELQAWERQFEPSMPAPQDAADLYLGDMLAHCDASGGRVLLAERGGEVVGFIGLMTKTGLTSTIRSNPIPTFQTWSFLARTMAGALAAG